MDNKNNNTDCGLKTQISELKRFKYTFEICLIIIHPSIYTGIVNYSSSGEERKLNVGFASLTFTT